MAAIEVGTNGRLNPRSVVRLAQTRRTAADNYALGAETGAATNFTVTFVIIPATGSVTCDYSAVGP